MEEVFPVEKRPRGFNQKATFDLLTIDVCIISDSNTPGWLPDNKRAMKKDDEWINIPCTFCQGCFIRGGGD